MRCPSCDRMMRLVEGENEKTDGRLYPYTYFVCDADGGCDLKVHDYEDEFDWKEAERISTVLGLLQEQTT